MRTHSIPCDASRSHSTHKLGFKRRSMARSACPPLALSLSRILYYPAKSAHKRRRRAGDEARRGGPRAFDDARGRHRARARSMSREDEDMRDAPCGSGSGSEGGAPAATERCARPFAPSWKKDAAFNPSRAAPPPPASSRARRVVRALDIARASRRANAHASSLPDPPTRAGVRRRGQRRQRSRAREQRDEILRLEAARRRVLYTGSHTTPFARWTPILKDFRRLISPPTPRFQSPPSTPFNSI